MTIDGNDTTGVERPRARRLVSIVAFVVPVVLVVGASAWFVRAYVMPPMITIQEPALASPQTTPQEPQAAVAAITPPETTGTAQQPLPAAEPPPAPTFRYSTNSSEVWASVPLPSQPRMALRDETDQAPVPAIMPGTPAAAPVPLPPQRPRVSASAHAAVPLPRPRPAN